MLEVRLKQDADRLSAAAQELQRLQGLSKAAAQQAAQLSQDLQSNREQQYNAVAAVVAAMAKAKSSMPAQQVVGPGGKQLQQQGAAASPAAAAAARLASMQLHTSCQQLLAHALAGRQLLEQAAETMSGAESEAVCPSSSSSRTNGGLKGTGDVGLIESFMAQQAARAAKEQQEEEQRQRQEKLEAHAQRQARIENAKREAALQQQLAAQQVAEQEQQQEYTSGSGQQEAAAAAAGSSSWQQYDRESLAGSEGVAADDTSDAAADDDSNAGHLEVHEQERELPEDGQLRLLNRDGDGGELFAAAGSGRRGSTASSVSSTSTTGMQSEASVPATTAGAQDSGLVCKATLISSSVRPCTVTSAVDGAMRMQTA